MTIHTLNQLLQTKNLALQNMGGADVQTFVGAAATGTQGSAIAFGPLAPVTFRAVPKFWLIERRTMTTWEKLAQPQGYVDRLVAGAPTASLDPDPSALKAGRCVPPGHPEPDHVEINYSPYPANDGTHSALLTERWRVSCQPAGVGMSRGAFFLSLEEFIAVAADRGGLAPELFPTKTSAVRDLLVSIMQQMAQPYYANISHVVFQIGALSNAYVYGVELSFDVNIIKAAVAENLSTAMTLADQGIYHCSPPCLRFVAPASALISMQNGRKSATMEFGVFTIARGAEELLRRYEEIFVSEKYGARPHWGLDRNFIRGEKTAERLYPDTWRRFRGAMDVLNPNGTFDGSITDRLGISRS